MKGNDTNGDPAPGDERLRTSETQFRILVQGVADYAIYMLDPTGHVSSWNPGAQRIKGYQPDEIVGAHFSQFYTEEDRAVGVPERNLSIASETGRVEDEGWRVRKDGSRFWAHVVIDRILDERGDLVGFAKITRDVTEQRAATQQLEQAREALFQAQKMEAIGQLTGGMAHDFNNLLMAVQGALELLRRRLPDDARTQSIFETAMAGLSRGASLTQRMLAFARRQELRPTAVDIPALVHGMSEMTKTTLGSRIMVTTRFPLSLEPAMVDPHQLELALLNLLVNARDAMPSGGNIEISAFVETILSGHPSGLAEGRYVSLSVTDDGQGMPPETLARAADPFFTTKGVGKGTGLGLSMVHGLAEQSNGRLSIESEEGKGTTITLRFPVASRQGGPTGRGGTRTTSAPQGFASGPPLKILAVDDDSLVRETLCAMLEDMGHVVVAAESAKHAIVAFETPGQFDLLVTDFSMPGMTGAELAEALRRLQPDLPIVVATGYAEALSEASPDITRLSKPFDRAALASAIAAAAARLASSNGPGISA
ncbi:PAS domain-containing sensor histidine kinase [Luteibacter sp. SG786]|uniref:PAS domain-containing sensor histidine kinase n=1 Tax=Luteibacter sp. SG786 TaxID=2587130 RepID=UPI001ABBA53F|nr:PAS domain-containing sensor histidine kinase [Luteibacter sp. SG786]NII53987.1 PAS domain S-box-containing protein [Luteibacter sp. SG786]